MKSKRTMIAALIGLAMLATPIAAAAKDHKDHGGEGRNYSHQSESRSFNAGNKHEFRNQRTWTPSVAPVRHDWNENHRDWNEGRHDNGWHNGWNRSYGDADDYQNYGGYGRYYGNRGYYNGPSYVTPYYGRSGYAAGGGACGWAQHVRNVYTRDRYTGHPSAARDLLPQLRRAEQACGGVPYGGGGLFSGYGAPAYENYGYNNNYNYGGYGQPYGYGYGNGASMLAPLLQQFVH